LAYDGGLLASAAGFVATPGPAAAAAAEVFDGGVVIVRAKVPRHAVARIKRY